MSKHSTAGVDVSHLAAFDADGAIREAADRLNAHNSRRGFLGGAGLLAGGVALAGIIPGSALAASSSGDVAILNYALTLEYLEEAFYARALKQAGLGGELKRFATVVHAHEAAHVTFLRKALGAKGVKKPRFDFMGSTASQSAFSQTAIVLEDTGVAAYQGQAGNLKSSANLAAAISIHPVEARHAAWIRNIAGQPPAPASFNPALSKSAVLSAVKGTGFIVN
jgi:hypothetical protein